MFLVSYTVTKVMISYGRCLKNLKLGGVTLKNVTFQQSPLLMLFFEKDGVKGKFKKWVDVGWRRFI